MKSIWLGSLIVVGLCFVPAQLPAQEKTAPSSQAITSLKAYDVNREVTVTGSVISYSATSQTAPAGPRVSLQTPSGLVDVHLGDARLLAAKQFTIQPGDTLRIVGENVAYPGGTQFIARIVQKGTQALLLRNARGFPISASAPNRSMEPAKQGSVL